MTARILHEYLLPGFVIGLIALGSHSVIQEQDNEEIEIVDQDGQRVDSRSVVWKVDTDKDGENENGKGDRELDIKVSDGQIVIIDENGEKQTIDVSGARNIIVNKSVRSIMRDGEEEKEVFGKAIIVGPDGEKQVIELGGDIEKLMQRDGNEFLLRMMPMLENQDERLRLPGRMFFSQQAGRKYMIGISCSTVSDELRAHLDLEDEVGLVVSGDPSDGSPAAEAGIEKHDILVYADQDELRSIEDLVEAVQKAGEEDREISLTLVRRGKEIGVDVKPAERKQQGGANQFRFSPDGGELDFQFEKIGPGFIFDNDNQMPERLLERMEQIDERIRRQMEDLTDLQEEFRRSLRDRDESDDN